jgi:peptidoglycan-associated lipoprotein
MKHAMKFAGLAFILILGGCRHQVAPSLVMPLPPAPTARLSANPITVQKGQPITLTWQTENATDVRIDGIGEVGSDGFWQVMPDDSTTYHLTAKGAGGMQEATTHITVAGPGLPASSGQFSEVIGRGTQHPVVESH